MLIIEVNKELDTAAGPVAAALPGGTGGCFSCAAAASIHWMPVV